MNRSGLRISHSKVFSSDSFRPRIKILGLPKVKDDNFVLNNFVDNKSANFLCFD